MNEINFIFAFFLGFMVCLLLERVVGPLLDDFVKKVNKQDPQMGRKRQKFRRRERK